MIPESQCGFRSGFSTTNALTLVTNSILENYDKGLASILVLLDFSKAFDTINHQLLYSKPKDFGFDNVSLVLVYSYLSDRTQCICNNDSKSYLINIRSGVPQGSVLGPLFFILYTADILRSIRNVGVQSYADDTQLYHSFLPKDYALVNTLINSELSCLNQLVKEHNLNLNPNKSQVMLFCSNNKRGLLKSQLSININNKKLDFVECANNLGVKLDTSLRFKSHVTKLV